MLPYKENLKASTINYKFYNKRSAKKIKAVITIFSILEGMIMSLELCLPAKCLGNLGCIVAFKKKGIYKCDIN